MIKLKLWIKWKKIIWFHSSKCLWIKVTGQKRLWFHRQWVPEEPLSLSLRLNLEEIVFHSGQMLWFNKMRTNWSKKKQREATLTINTTALKLMEIRSLHLMMKALLENQSFSIKFQNIKIGWMKAKKLKTWILNWL